MKTEELTEEKGDSSLKFDAHEFDGLREALEKEAAGMISKVDHFVRKNPILSVAIAAAVGFLVASAARKACADREEKE